MPLEHSEATVTMSFTGLALFRLMDAGNVKQCEIGILQCPRHKLRLFIEEVTLDNDGKTALRSLRVPHNLDLTKDIHIDVDKPFERGVKPHLVDEDPNKVFSRRDDTGDEEDFRWVVDFESPEFYNDPITIEPVAVFGEAKSFAPKIFVSDGILFTERTTDELFARQPLRAERPLIDQDFLGRVAFKIGLDIKCGNGSTGVVVRNEAGAPVTLAKQDGKKYFITVENLCPIPDQIADGSDFRLYYDAIKPPKADDEQFDLRRVVRKARPGGAALIVNVGPVVTINDFESDKFPQTCSGASAGIIRT